MSFERYFMELKSNQKAVEINLAKAKSTMQLFEDSDLTSQAELQWRIAAPISIPLLLFLAIPYARVPPRKGKFARLLPGLMIYIGYIIILLTMRRFIVAENITPWLGTWWVHVALLLYGYSEFTQWQWYKNFQQSRNRDNSTVAVKS